MKIGIITFHNAHNYGAMLQAFALSKKLKENKTLEIKIINYYNYKIYKQYKIIRPFCKNPLRLLKRLYEDITNYNLKKKRYKNFNIFITTKCKLSNKTFSKEETEKECNDYDVLITGSDQVWNPQIVGQLSDIYTLNFGKKQIKRISYAASVGDPMQINLKKDEFFEKLSLLDFISVREVETQNKLSEIIKKPIEVVLDPTLLIEKEDWDKEIENIPSEKEKYILAYVIEPDEEYFKIVNDLSIKTGLKVIHFGIKNKGYKYVLKSAYTEGPLEFVNYIKNAEFVVATSFHATVFSIIFNKKFWIIPHRKTGGRVTNLLDKLNISSRAISSFDDFTKKNYDENIDYDKTNIILEEERKKSIEWLINSIRK